MTVTLTPEQEKFIAEQMDKGGYSSPEKVLDEALKLIQVKEEYRLRREQLKRDLQVGMDQLERGESLDGHKVFEEILQKNSQRPRPK